MAQSGFEDKRGLAYPPNVEPRLESWMERVRVTLGKLLDASVDAARINTVTLDVDESGNVTAQITPNENTKWIEYYGLTTLYPTISEIVTSGTEVRVWDTPGETYTTGTLITLTDGQTYFFGAVAYEEEDATMTAPALSTSVPVYAEITWSAPGAADGDTIVPTVEETVDVTGLTGTVTLVITDPLNYVTQVSWRSWTGGAWNSWVDDTTFPYDLTENVTLQELHNVGLEWKVLYDLGGSRGVEQIGNVVMFDIDINPELSEGYLTVDTTDGDVIYRYVGDDDTLSVAYATSATDWTTDALAKTAAEAGTPIDGRTGPATGGTVVYAGLAEGATRFFAVSANDAANATGNFGSQIYRYQITRPTDTTTDTDTIPPRVVGDVTYDGSGNATLSLLVSWGTYSTGTVEFKAKSGEAAWEAAWTEDTTSPFEHSVVLDEKHDSHIKYLVTYGSSLTIGDIVTIDIDNAPELQTASVTVNDSGDARLTWAGDDDVDYIKWKVFTGANLDDTDYPAWTTPADGDATRSPTSGDARNYEVVVATGMTEGHDCLVSFYCFNTVTGNNSLILYKVRDSYPTDTTTDTDTIVPSVQVTAGSSDITLAIDDPSDYVNAVGFRTYTMTGTPPAGAWGSWTDDTTVPYLLTWPVTREDKHNVYIGWRVKYDIGGGDRYLERSVMFDPDNVPEMNSVNLTVDESGDVYLAYSGDDDTLSIKYILHASGYQSRATVISSGTTLDGTSRTDELLESGIAEGASRWITVVPYTGANATGSPSYAGWSKRVTRPTDTIGTSDPAINAKRVLDADGDIRLRWYATTGDALSAAYIVNKTTGGTDGFSAASTDPSHSDWNTASWQDRHANYRGNFIDPVATLAWGESAYISMLGFDELGGGPGSGNYASSVFTTVVERVSKLRGTAPAQIVYADTTPGEGAEFVTGDLWYETIAEPWIKRVFDSTKGAGLKWTKGATTFPLGKALNSVGGTKSQVLTPWPLIVFKDNGAIDGSEQVLSWAVSEGSSDFRVSAAVITLIDAASDIEPGAIAGRSTGQYMKWNGSAHEWGTPPTGASTLPSLNDVTITATAEGDYLRYTAGGTEQWEDVTITQIRDDLLTVDGTGSGLDADKLDGQHGTYYSVDGHNHDHGLLIGVSDDDHTMYSRTSGLRAFTATVGGVYPTANAHLATKEYVDDVTLGGISIGGSNTADYTINIDSNDGGTNYFYVKAGSGAANSLRLDELGNMTLYNQGNLYIYGDLQIGAGVGADNASFHVNVTGYVTIEVESSSRHFQIDTYDSSHYAYIWDGTTRSQISTLDGYATGTGQPGVTAVKGSLYIRHA